MKRVALTLTWLIFALCLYGAFRLGSHGSGSIGYTFIPVLLLGPVLAVLHTRVAKPAAIWLAFALNAVWGLMGSYVLLVSLVVGDPSVMWGLLIGAFTLGPAIPNSITLYRRRNEWTATKNAV